MVLTRAHRHRWGLWRGRCSGRGGSGSSAWAWTTSGAPGSTPPRGRPRSVILAFCPGAPSHIDTWDPKPDAPLQVRGEFATIATRTPGLRVCEHLPRAGLALGPVLADPLDDPRRAGARAGGATPCSPGSPGRRRTPPSGPTGPPTGPTSGPSSPTPAPPRPTCRRPSSSPPSSLRGATPSPARTPGSSGRVRPLARRGRPERPGLPALPRSTSPRGPSLSRPARRDNLLAEVDARRRELERGRRWPGSTTSGTRPWALLASRRGAATPSTSTAKTRRLRDRYGRHLSGPGPPAGPPPGRGRGPARPGQHRGHEPLGHAQRQLHDPQEHPAPPLDRGVSALLEDLEARGLLRRRPRDLTGEFGRTRASARKTTSPTPPARARPLGRRLHHAGLRRRHPPRPGPGASDKIGAYPASTSYTPADLAATVYRQVGIDPTTRSATGSAVRSASTAAPPSPRCSPEPPSTTASPS